MLSSLFAYIAAILSPAPSFDLRMIVQVGDREDVYIMDTNLSIGDCVAASDRPHYHHMGVHLTYDCAAH